MEDVKIANEAAVYRASILSERLTQEKKISQEHLDDVLAPSDTYYVVHIIFFFFGLGSMLPMTFFLTSQQYWMYKFRDPSSEEIDLDHKTELQANFVSYSSITQSIPSVIVTLLATRYGHKINIRTRLLTTVIIILSSFIVFTAFIKINTDTWQVTFFILTMLVSAIITVSQTVFSVALLSLLARFPPKFIKIQMYGSATAGLFSATLQIICLYVGKNPTKTALIYFCGGTAVMLITTICTFISKYSARFRYYVGDVVADTQRKTQTLSEMWATAKQIYPNVILMFVGVIAWGMGHPNITTLVVSENYGHGYEWNDVYFTPVITFFWTNIVNILGRMCARPILTRKSTPWYLAADLGRIVVFAPVFFFCNAKTSHERRLPVLFPHDWQYILILTLNVFIAEFFATCSFLSVKNLIPDNPEQGYMLIQQISGIIGSLASPLGTLWVHLL